MEARQYKQDDVIFHAGDAADCMYEICSGRVSIVAGYGTPEEKLLTTLGSGEYFGEMAMIEARQRSATAVAASASVLLEVVTWQTLGEFFRERPAKVVMIMQQMGRRIRELTEDYMGACKAISEMADRAEAERRTAEAAWINDKMRRYLDAYRALGPL
jgi:CRP-like cAMP-binding protein